MDVIADKEILLNYQKNLRMFRKLAGWTQEELAERVGVSRYTIINLENGYGTGEHKVDISWNSSDDSIISNNGSVSRPTDNDTYITLTATLNKDSARHSKEFRVRVIKVSATLTEDIEDKSLIDLQKMNENSEYPLEIDYNDDETQVEFISGQFSEITVNSVESALQSICSVRSLIGLENPSDELEWKSTNHSDSTLAYSFKQMYKNIPVYGSAVTVSADPIYGKTLSLSSSVIPTDILQNVDFQNILSTGPRHPVLLRPERS